MITTQQAPPTVTQHAVAWIMNEWSDPRRRRSMRRECDDVMHPLASHPDCDRISGVYHEGGWLVYISAQAMNPHDRVRVVFGNSVYATEFKRNLGD